MLNGATGLLQDFVAAATDLVDLGAEAITTNCGFLSIFQREIAAAVGVPVATSSLMQVPWVQATLPPGKRVGIVSVSAQSLTPAHLGGAGVPLDAPIAGTENGREFFRVLIKGEKQDLDVDLARQDVVDAGKGLVARLHLRELAEAERRKAALETQSAAILTRLGLIGQELTRHLDRPSIYASLAGHIPALLDASGFEIYLVSQEGLGLTSVFGLEHGERLPEDFIPMDDPVSNTARCAREQRELLVALAADGTDPTQVPGTMRTLSALFAPLKVGDRVLGVMTVQSPHAQAYGAHETQVFRSLCAYAAIALDNASAYQRCTMPAASSCPRKSSPPWAPWWLAWPTSSTPPWATAC